MVITYHHKMVKDWRHLVSQYSMTVISEILVYMDLKVLSLNFIAKTRGPVLQW